MKYCLRWLVCVVWAIATAGAWAAWPGLGANAPTSAAASFRPLAGEPMPAEEAFRFSARALDTQTLEATWTIHAGYYLYRDKVSFTSEPPLTLIPEAFPPGEAKDDPQFGRVEIYRDQLRLTLPLLLAQGAGQTLPATLTLTGKAQGCWDGGLCYPPMAVSLPINLAKTAIPATANPAADAPGQDESGRLARLLKHSSFWGNLLTFFGLGLLLAFTPCVLPMVPILSSIIVHHGHALTHARAFALSLAYVLGMALTYALVGVAAGLSGALFSSALQNPWVLGTFALFFVMLALSMFGFYELQLPAALQSRLSEAANARGGSWPALAAMGAISALIVGPCIAAPLAGALLYIAQTRDALLGGAVLFSLALGMGAPLLAVGLFSRSILPKPGPWMDAVKRAFGVVMLAVALWLIRDILPAWLFMLGIAVLLIVPAIYLHALDPLPHPARSGLRFWKGIGVLLLIAGTAMLAGVLGGSRDPLRPLQFLTTQAAVPEAQTTPRFTRINHLAELETRLAQANRPVILDFYADWCISCKEMERETFADPAVAARLRDFLLLQVDVTQNTAEDIALLKRFDLFGPPGMIFFDSKGQQIERAVGFIAATEFLQLLNRIAPPPGRATSSLT